MAQINVNSNKISEMDVTNPLLTMEENRPFTIQSSDNHNTNSPQSLNSPLCLSDKSLPKNILNSPTSNTNTRVFHQARKIDFD